MPMQDIGAGFARPLHHVALRRQIAQSNMPAHRHARQPERKLAAERFECRIGVRSARGGIRHNADPVATRRLRARKVDHVTKQPADRRPQDVQDLQGSGPWHVQNQRSAILMVSPGVTG